MDGLLIWPTLGKMPPAKRNLGERVLTPTSARTRSLQADPFKATNATKYCENLICMTQKDQENKSVNQIFVRV